MLFGMLTHSPDGKLCLEDLEGRVELDIRNTVWACFFYWKITQGNVRRRGHVKVCSPRGLWFSARGFIPMRKH
jgi:hypothetical protein